MIFRRRTRPIRPIRGVLTAALAISLCSIAPGALAQEASANISPERDLPPAREASGINGIRRHHLHRYDSNWHYTPPSRHLVAVPAGEKRKGPAEHLLIDVTSSLNSQYVSKELPDSKGPVWQPSATVEFYGVGFNVWSNFVLGDEANQGQFNEVDFTAYYTAHIGKLTLHPYFAYFVYPNGNPASLDYTSASQIEADLYIQYNVGDFDLFGRMRTRLKHVAGQIYANVGVGYNHAFPCGMTLIASGLLNMGDSQYLTSQYGPTDTNIDAISFMLGASWKVYGVTFRPNAHVAIHVVPEIRRKIRQNPNLDTYLVWGGLDLSYDF